MLPAGARMRRARDFSTTIRFGRRLTSRRLVLHLLVAPTGRTQPVPPPTLPEAPSQPLVGLVVGRGIGNAVVRHRVARRLRHLLADRLDLLPRGALLVVRALPSATSATSAQLADDLDSALALAAAAGSSGSGRVRRPGRSVEPRTLAVVSPA